MSDLTKREALEKIEELKVYVEGLGATPVQKAKKLLSVLGISYNTYGYLARAEVVENPSDSKQAYIKFPLPNAHTDWTLDVFGAVKKLCLKGEEHFNRLQIHTVYPIFYSFLDTSVYMYVCVDCS